MWTRYPFSESLSNGYTVALLAADTLKVRRFGLGVADRSQIVEKFRYEQFTKANPGDFILIYLI
jgi:hypothetical protein